MICKIKLGRGEFITKISGTSGEYTYAGHDRVISTLKIYTNFNPKGYGPFGTGEDTKNVTAFSSPDELEGRFVGFFGNAPGFIYSLGIYAEKVTTMFIRIIESIFKLSVLSLFKIGFCLSLTITCNNF